MAKKIKKAEVEEDFEAYNELSHIKIHGAREHNLKNISLEIPRDKLVVITGLSGSGKSSLAFDTIYGEGQRRYVESLSAYARQFLGVMKKPDVDLIEGLSPAISIEQKSVTHNPRSTVGTVTEINDYIRLLWSKVGVQYCVDCNVPVMSKTQEQILEDIMIFAANKKIQILAPLIIGRKGHYRELFSMLQKTGFTRCRIDGTMRFIEQGMELSRYETHDIDLVVDRCTATPDMEKRINASLDIALNKGNGIVKMLVEADDDFNEKLYSTAYTCPSCGKGYEPLAPNKFSYNSPYGACAKCSGTGEVQEFDVDSLIPDKNISLNQGAISLVDIDKSDWTSKQISAFAKKNDISLDTPIQDIPADKLEKLLWGDKNEKIMIKVAFGDSMVEYPQSYNGIIPLLMHQAQNSRDSVFVNSFGECLVNRTCPECGGFRLKKENLSVLIHNISLRDLMNLEIDEARTAFQALNKVCTDRELKISALIFKEIDERLSFLEEVGLKYLSLNRSAKTLSGGESQRIKLAAQIGSELVGALYVLDEPSIGLHQKDNHRLIESLKKLRDLGNSVIVVEHDRAMIEQSDYLVDLGPGAGIHGGEIALAMEYSDIKNASQEIIDKSLTAQYLLDLKEIEIPEKRREGNGKEIVLSGAIGHNLKNVDLKLPLGKFICISGMSGSGKSSLINRTLYPILARKFYRAHIQPLKYKNIEGLEHIDKIIEIDQSPIGRTPRSNPATYTGLFTHIRDFYSQLPEAKIRGYKAGRFSFNVRGGRCDACEGAGIVKIEMNFLPDVYVKCDVCNGDRYNAETLQVKYKNKSIAEALDLTVEEALDFFSELPRIRRKIETLSEVGLGYIKLGQQATTLSGGEAQRVKLATELTKLNTGKTLYLLDEPTTGLHFEDVKILLKMLNSLVDKGNTIVVIEHNLDVVKCADWVIDLGPEGGKNGGYIVAEGTPEALIKKKKSLTGYYLKTEAMKKK